MTNVWYMSYDLDGMQRQVLDGDPFKTFDSPEEVKQALDRWALRFKCQGQTFAVCKETYKKVFDESGRIVRIETIVKAVEYYTAAKEEIA